MPKPEQTQAAERKKARRAHVESFSAKLDELDGKIEAARAFVKSAGLREFTRAEVELMLKRAELRAGTFEHLILKPLRGDLKRRDHDKRKQ